VDVPPRVRPRQDRRRRTRRGAASRRRCARGSCSASATSPRGALRGALSQASASLEEAARLAGGPWLALRRVTLPLASPGVLVGALFVFLFALNDFSLVDYLNFVRPTGERISVYPYESFTAWTKNQGESVATALGAPLASSACCCSSASSASSDGRSCASLTGDFRAPTPWQLGG
jgi:ABC-type Fe3+ transport system permease subunit